MDTVWIRLTLVKNPVSKMDTVYQEHFMFGPTGIVRFFCAAGRTILYRSNDIIAAEVQETDEYIMDILRKVRKTEGALDVKGKRRAKEISKDKAPKAKAKSKSK